MDYKKIGQFISTLRKNKKLTQEQLANKLNITKNAVSKWERGLGLMDLSLLKPLSEILEVSITELLSGEKFDEENIIQNTEEIVENTISYANEKINKEKNKNMFIGFLIIIISIIGMFFCYKLILIIKYNTKGLNSKSEIVDGLKKDSNLKIYKKTIEEEKYILFDNIKIRNDFKNYEIIKNTYPEGLIKLENKNKNDDIQYIYISKGPQIIDVFTDDNLFFSNTTKINNTTKYFTSADRKYFLLKNDINNDVDYFKFVKNNYIIESNIFMSKRTILENYAFNIFSSIVIPKTEYIKYISGDYQGYITKINKSQEVNIIRDDYNYKFYFFGENLDEKYIIELLSTLEIK